MENENLTFPVLACNLTSAVERLKKLAKKYQKNTGQVLTWTVGETRIETTMTESGRKISVRYRDITVNALDVAPNIAGWNFLAKVELGVGGNIIDKVSSAVIPVKYRETDCSCEHCKINRARKNVFLLENDETKEIIQVGSACLKDFLGKETPADILWKFKFIRELREKSDEYFGGPSMQYTLELLAVTSAAIRLYGWISKSAAGEDETPTCSRISDYFFGSHKNVIKKELEEALSDEDWQIAEEARAWVMESDSTSDYIYNLQVILKADVLESKRHAIACSAVGSYLRAKAKLAEKAVEAQSSDFFGNIGDKLKNVPMILEQARGIRSDWGDSMLYKFRDENGHVFSWFASASKDIAPGTKVWVSGSIKAHKEYKGYKETQLTRCRLA